MFVFIIQESVRHLRRQKKHRFLCGVWKPMNGADVLKECGDFFGNFQWCCVVRTFFGVSMHMSKIILLCLLQPISVLFFSKVKKEEEGSPADSGIFEAIYPFESPFSSSFSFAFSSLFLFLLFGDRGLFTLN